MTVLPTLCLSCRFQPAWKLCRKSITGAPTSSRPQAWRRFTSNALRLQHDQAQHIGDKTSEEQHVSLLQKWQRHHMGALDSPMEIDGGLLEALDAQVPPDHTLEPPSNNQVRAVLERQAFQDPSLQPSFETIARAARQTFGDSLPDGTLNPEQYKVYERLYGTPPRTELRHGPENEDVRDVLYRQGEDGSLEELDILEPDPEPHQHSGFVGEADLDGMEGSAEPLADTKPSQADDELQRDIATAFGVRGALDTHLTIAPPDSLERLEEQDNEDEDAEDAELGTSSSSRAHPFTLASRFGTIPSTLPLPQSSFTGPVGLLLSNISNKHLDESAYRIFDGSALPDSPSTPSSSRTKPQRPIPLNAAQSKMSDIEADLYMAAVMPQTYAAVLSVLVETRKRLGTTWLEDLLKRKGGARILDAGAGGAGVIAWREVLKAEWKRMHQIPDPDPSQTSAASDIKPGHQLPPTPLGKATVLTGSTNLSQRASVLLEDTTFLPRLPDYVHASSQQDESQRKYFDVIVAPHSLWHLQENYERRLKIQNLWSLLDPKGGVLILLEKGVPRGFEVIADARSYIVDQLFERKVNAVENLDEIPYPTEEPSVQSTAADSSSDNASFASRTSRRVPAHIVAPCPHSFKCPLYLVPGISRQRKDYCRFRQRYIRPAYLQRILGVKDRNFDDVEFSYIAVQKGVTLNERNDQLSLSAKGTTLLGSEADLRAFQGYQLNDPDVLRLQTDSTSPVKLPSPLPRILLPPLKRHGHVHLDMCTPSGSLSRWTVPKSFGKQAYRDARKAAWGDLWALGAKQKEGRRARLGTVTGKNGSIRDVKKSMVRVARIESKNGKHNSEESAETDNDNFGSRPLDDAETFARQERIRRIIKAKSHGRSKARMRRKEETRALFDVTDI